MTIYISAHTDWHTPCPTNPTYKIVTSQEAVIDKPLDIIRDHSPLLPLQHAYNEGTRMYHVWKSCPQTDFIGFVQYRKYFSFFDDIPDIKRLFNKYDVILPEPFRFGHLTTLRQYELVHNIGDLYEIGTILIDLYPEYSSALQQTLQSRFMYGGNIFIMRYEDFDQWCRFVFSILNRFNQIHHFTTDADVAAYITDNYHLYQHASMNSIDYQSRLHGFLLERLTNAFIYHHFHHPIAYPLTIYHRTLPSLHQP